MLVLVTSNSDLIPLIKISTLEHVHPIITKFFTKSIPNVPLAGRLPYFITASEKNSLDQEILSIVKGYETIFICKFPISGENTKLGKNFKRTIFISGAGSFGNVGAIQKVVPTQGQFLKNLFLVEKKRWRKPPGDKFEKSQ